MTETQSELDEGEGPPYDYHFIPVSTPEKEVILPIVREHLEADKITIIPVAGVTEGAEQLADTLIEMFGYDTSIGNPLESPQKAYETAYQQLSEYLERDGENSLWVNVSRAEGAWGIAFSQAATTLQIEHPDHRPNITVYTVSNDGEPQLLGSAPSDTPTEIGETILKFLLSGQTPASVTELAQELANGELDETFRSKIHYNVKKLEKQGYIKRVGDYKMSPHLTPTGQMWIRSHPQETENY